MRKLGSLEPVFYFVNHTDPTRPPGYLMLAPYSACPAPAGWSREYADTLPDVDRLQKRLQEQEFRAMEAEGERSLNAFRAKQDELRVKLHDKMVSSSTSPWERDFLRGYLMLAEERRAKYRQRFMERNMYLWARENDTPKDRRVDEEKVNLDRVNF
jgi:hypothetical protein